MEKYVVLKFVNNMAGKEEILNLLRVDINELVDIGEFDDPHILNPHMVAPSAIEHQKKHRIETLDALVRDSLRIRALDEKLKQGSFKAHPVGPSFQEYLDKFQLLNVPHIIRI